MKGNLSKFLLCLTLVSSSFNASAKSEPAQQEFEVKMLGANSTYECELIGETTIAVSFSFEEKDNVKFVLEGFDGKKIKKIVSTRLKGVSGEKTISFDAGECLNQVKSYIQ